MKDLTDVRSEIDQIDTEILRLFLARMDCARQVAQIKSAQKLPVFNAAREDEILQKRAAQAGAFGKKARVLYSMLMDLSRSYQHELLDGETALCGLLQSACREALPAKAVVVCQGIAGAYSHQAALRFFPEGEIAFCSRFEDVFRALAEGSAEFGVLPVENSAAGSVAEVCDLMLRYRYFVVDALSLPVAHCLCAVPGAEESGLTAVCSHPQALAQCAAMISAHGYRQEVCSNTAVAAALVAQRQDPTLGALCSTLAAKQAGLQILRENVQDSALNQTRFFVISRTLRIALDASKLSLCFSTPHKAGALHRTLTQISAAGLNLTKIESRPIPEKPFEYLFYVELSANAGLADTANLLCALSGELPNFAFLGNYPEL